MLNSFTTSTYATVLTSLSSQSTTNSKYSTRITYSSSSTSTYSTVTNSIGIVNNRTEVRTYSSRTSQSQRVVSTSNSELLNASKTSYPIWSTTTQAQAVFSVEGMSRLSEYYPSKYYTGDRGTTNPWHTTTTRYSGNTVWTRLGYLTFVYLTFTSVANSTTSRTQMSTWHPYDEVTCTILAFNTTDPEGWTTYRCNATTQSNIGKSNIPGIATSSYTTTTLGDIYYHSFTEQKVALEHNIQIGPETWTLSETVVNGHFIDHCTVYAWNATNQLAEAYVTTSSEANIWDTLPIVSTSASYFSSTLYQFTTITQYVNVAAHINSSFTSVINNYSTITTYMNESYYSTTMRTTTSISTLISKSQSASSESITYQAPTSESKSSSTEYISGSVYKTYTSPNFSSTRDWSPTIATEPIKIRSSYHSGFSYITSFTDAGHIEQLYTSSEEMIIHSTVMLISYTKYSAIPTNTKYTTFYNMITRTIHSSEL